VQGGDPLSRKGIQKVGTRDGHDEALEIMASKETATEMSTTTTMRMTMIIGITGVRATKKTTTIINTADTGGSRISVATVMKKITMMTTIVVRVIIMMKKTMMTLIIGGAGHVAVPAGKGLLPCREKM
jgi:hypothetical protein